MDRLDLLFLRHALFTVKFDTLPQLDHIESPAIRAASLPTRQGIILSPFLRGREEIGHSSIPEVLLEFALLSIH